MSEQKEYTETLTGHTSPETAHVVNDYPYGFRLRTSIRYWIETKKGHGQRFCSQTLNPKTGAWNKPKAGNYHVIAVMVRNPENGYVSYETLQSGGWSEEGQIVDFETRHAAALGEWETKAIKYIRATNKANELVKVTIHQAGYDENGNRTDTPAQTREEQAAIWDRAVRVGYAQVTAEGK
jgi:hypothetical protein